MIVPSFTIADESADYESELGVILGRDCKNVSEADAMSYVLGYSECFKVRWAGDPR